MIVLNHSPVATLSDELVDLADVVVANSAEDAALAIDPKHEQTMVVTLGGRGALARTSSCITTNGPDRGRRPRRAHRQRHNKRHGSVPVRLPPLTGHVVYAARSAWG
jgi:hypothetical protein